MRPLRLLLSISTSLVAGTLLLFLALSSPQDEGFESESDASNTGSVRALFSFTSPGSLFPPSAIISLTDDNSTFFLARPAAFGPALPKHGLSGPLWIGVGFGDDTTGRGELGCGDVPGWEDADKVTTTMKRALFDTEASIPNRIALDDGTDNHLQPPIPKSAISPDTAHADIQSLQESAEMAGKVALLKRGGCGFLAKVLWAQKRGATAVIVGDDVPGGPLIRMYAKGDTSNITIPSLFTSHTTAHLLSSLLPSKGSLQELMTGEKTKYTDAQREKRGSSQDRLEASDAPRSRQHYSGWLHSLLLSLGLGHSNGDDNHLSTVKPDDFIIGEQDWRDPDLQSSPLPTNEIQEVSTSAPVTSKPEGNMLPGSGEYASEVETDAEHKIWWSRPSKAHKDGSSTARISEAKARSITSITGAEITHVKTSMLEPSPHQGLWVTLTPTTVSSSPFFDTLLVLVVSPLVTLTVVYALLLLRSRIRRRRWRAPKSVVERLPVRTYQTISESSSSATPSASSPTTPLLQHSPSQPASPTASRPQDVPTDSSSIRHESRDREEEKRESGLAAWRRRYGGRQKECVVCLEEYEHGVSQVMSLPCGHEFHADCITPWLVTRRRTCPICKGDVVRSLSQSYHDRLGSPSPTRSSRFANHDDDVQTQAAETRNDSPSASRPVPVSMSAAASDDIEAGWSGAGAQPENRSAEPSSSLREMSSTVSTIIWRGFEAVRNSSGFQRRPPLADVDRNR